MGVTPGEERQFTEFVREHGDRLLRFTRLLVPDAAEAEDLLQVALLRLVRHWGRQLEAPDAYVRRTLVNLANDRSRRRHLVPVPSPVDPDEHPCSPDHAVALAAQAQLDGALASLPARQRITVVLRILEGMNEAETATAMNCSPGTVKSNLSRGLDKLRTALDPIHPAQRAGR